MKTALAAVLLLAAAVPAAGELTMQGGIGFGEPGLLENLDGAHAEYHYLDSAKGLSEFRVSTYRSDMRSQRAWRVIEDGEDSILAQMESLNWKGAHPIVVTVREQPYDRVWVKMAPGGGEGQSGLLFRYRNDRCYYFLGVCDGAAQIRRVAHGDAFRTLDEKVLAEAPLEYAPEEWLDVSLVMDGPKFRGQVGGVVLEAEDDTYAEGRLGLLSDGPAKFRGVRVSMDHAAWERYCGQKKAAVAEDLALQARHPKPVLWKKFNTEGYGVGRNLRFGDLDGDGQTDILFGQVVHHGPKDRNSELGCLTATTLDGKILWQIGEPDPWKDHLTNDVAFQIHDVDGDGRCEVVYTMNMELVIADGVTGRTRIKIPTPETPPNTKPEHSRFPRILGDSLFFCDLRGTGRPADIILKDRYLSVWTFTDKLEPLWHAQCNTGHYPFAFDTDNDGRDELAMGYTLFDHDGRVLWCRDESLQDHADGVAIVRLNGDGSEPVWLCAASDEGMIVADTKGNILQHHYVGHVQNPATADFRPDLPGLETVSINFWSNQGIVHFYDSQMRIYHEFEPVQHGSMCSPVNWTGQPGELWALSANPNEGGLYDGYGRRAVRFPVDGHPDLCCAALDLTGDCRDEIIVWDPYELWIYTQSDNPLTGKLYKPIRNPQYNNSNYQATVSLPGWSTETSP